MKLKNCFIQLHWLLCTQFGFDPRVMLRSLSGLSRYVRDLVYFRRGYRGRLYYVPCLQDWSEEGGSTKSEYFWQDLLVARMIFEARPQKHVDVGSRVDGFVAHVASFRDIEVFDVRKITAQVPGVIFKQADLMDPVDGIRDYCDSLSCLHALEHFGLGRYGDPVDPQGFERGLINMAALLRENGVLYLSVPVGVSCVEFNAQRIVDPRLVVALAREQRLRLSGFTVIGPGGKVEECGPDAGQLDLLAKQRKVLVVFVFLKQNKL
jgi:hypothetical protein